MKRLPLALFTVALLVAVAWPLSAAIGASASGHEPPVCREMTSAKMLDHPALAQEWADALRSAQPSQIARIQAMIAEIRAAHGCGREAVPALAQEPGLLPPGHPPIPGAGSLPPGHPPLGAPPHMPLFEAPAIVTI